MKLAEDVRPQYKAVIDPEGHGNDTAVASAGDDWLGTACERLGRGNLAKQSHLRNRHRPMQQAIGS
jgi:hypothetical protein